MKKKIDELGRVVIPRPYCKELGIELNQEIEIDKIQNKIIITNPKGMRSQEEIEQMLNDIKKLQLNEYNKGFRDALQMVLQQDKTEVRNDK